MNDKNSPIEALSEGLLGQFTSLKELEELLEQLLQKQEILSSGELRNLEMFDPKLTEISLMVRKSLLSA